MCGDVYAGGRRLSCDKNAYRTFLLVINRGDCAVSAILTVAAGDDKREFPCSTLLTIGRVPPSDVTFPQDPKVSRNHAMVRMMGDGKYYLIDLGSSNGTFVNGRRIMVPYELKNADNIGVGDSVCVFKCESTPDGQQVQEAVQSTLLTVGAAVQQMTILVTDIRNFTGLNEKLPPEQLARVLGRLFRVSTENVEKNGGVIDKFIGDAVMARWMTDGEKNINPVKSALSATLGMWQVVQELNKDFPELNNSLRIGAGINSGQAVMGTIGAGGYREYTAIGDSVNVAFRLESASKELGKDIVIGETSCALLPGHLWSKKLQSVSVKGKKAPLKVWALTFEELDKLIQRM